MVYRKAEYGITADDVLQAFDPYRPITLWDERHAWWQLMEHGLIRAETAKREADNYRRFLVGAAVLASKLPPSGPEERWRIFTAGNWMPKPNGPKLCAEMKAVLLAAKAGCWLIHGIWVVGEPQPDPVSGLEPPTLHPCVICREFFYSFPGISLDHTYVMTAPAVSGPVEHHSVGDLLDLHARHRA